MAQDIFKPVGTKKANKPDAGGANIRSVPVLGVVKNNIDPVRAGRIQVYIADFSSGDPDDADSWMTVSYMSPFYGLVESTSANTGPGTYKTNSVSYGFWNSPPDLGTTVICIFVNGDMNYGFYIGCVPKPEALHMVPAIGSSTNVVPNPGEASGYGGSTRLPVTNMNTNNSPATNGPNFLKEAKPIHSDVAMIMNQQGIIRDPIRGPISSSAQRESPSRVGWGISTPGRPIYQGGFTDATVADAAGNGGQSAGLKVISRRGGHSIVMDDGDQIGGDQLVRIRTSLGHQILMSDNGQTLMILHSNGQSYIELGKEGTIDMYSTNSVNIRTQGDLNLHADNDINIHAMKKLNIQAESININAEKDFNQKTGTNNTVYTMGTHTHKVDGAMSMESAGDASYASSGTTYINGSVVNLNTGATSTTPEVVPPLPVTAHTDTLYDSAKGFAAAPGKLISVVSRAPAHAPWANAGQGVDVQSTVNAKDALPSAPSAAVAATNADAQGAGATAPVTVAVASTMPPLTAVSAAIDPNTSAAMIGAMATNAATGPAAAAVAAGSGIVSTVQGAVASVGNLAQVPSQLEAAGILKPGAAALTNSLVQGGASVQSALTSNLFTGVPGAQNLTALIQNPTAQVNAAIIGLQQSQTALTAAGAMTGKEAPGAVAGIIMSGATAGVSATLSTIKNISGGVGTAVSGATNAVSNAINSGNLAAGLAQNVTGGLGSISTALGSMTKISGLGGLMDAAKGVAGSAFSAITRAFKPLQAGVPQNLTAIAEAAKAAEVAAAASAAGGLASAASGALGEVGGLTSAVTGALGGLTSAATGAAAGAPAGVASALASGVNALPGGQNAISAVVNYAKGATNAIPGTAAIGALLTNTTTAVTNGISLPNSISGAVGSITGAASNLLSKTTGAISGVFDKLKSGTASLASVATGGLPSAAAAQLNSAIAALGSGGAFPIKLPTVGLNTTDRSAIDGQIGSLLGAGIPKPNFSGTISAAAVSAQAANLAKAEPIAAALAEIQSLQDKATVAKDRFQELSNTLPQGDPQIAAASQELASLTKEVTDKQYAEFVASQPRAYRL
jgi:hypothetical protein